MGTIDKISELLKTNGKSQKQLCDYLGVSSNNFTDWKSGRIKSYTKYIDKIAAYFNVTTDYLLGTEKPEPSNIASWGTDGIHMIPVYEYVSAGNGCMANDCIVDYAPAIIRGVTDVSTYYWLHVKGDSMSPKIEDDDRVLVRQQSSVDSGAIAIVMIDGEDGVVKKIFYAKQQQPPQVKRQGADFLFNFLSKCHTKI